MSRRPVVLVEFSPSGGLFQFALQLGAKLAEQGEAVQLWTGPDPEIAALHPGLVVRSVLPTWHPGTPAPASEVVRLLRRVLRAGKLVAAWVVLAVRLSAARPRAVLWSHWRFAFEPMFVVAITKILPRTVFGMIAHEPLPRSDEKDTSTAKSGRILQTAFAAAWQRLDVAFTLGPRTRQLVLEHWAPRCPVYVIPHGDEAVFDQHTVTRQVEHTDPAALFFGTWSAYKGIETLLDAFELVRAELPDARLTLAGAVGADVDAAALVRRAQHIGNVEVRAGYVPLTEVPALLAEARLVVTPYLRASQSGVAHLAFTFGRPVVATDVGDLSVAVRDGVTGLLVPPGDPLALAAALRKLLTDPGLSAQLGATGRAGVTRAWTVAATTVTQALNDVEVS